MKEGLTPTPPHGSRTNMGVMEPEDEEAEEQFREAVWRWRRPDRGGGLQSSFCRSGLVPYSRTWASEWTVCSSSRVAFLPRIHCTQRPVSSLTRSRPTRSDPSPTHLALRPQPRLLQPRPDALNAPGVLRVAVGVSAHALVLLHQGVVHQP